MPLSTRKPVALLPRNKRLKRSTSHQVMTVRTTLQNVRQPHILHHCVEMEKCQTKTLRKPPSDYSEENPSQQNLKPSCSRDRSCGRREIPSPKRCKGSDSFLRQLPDWGITLQSEHDGGRFTKDGRAAYGEWFSKIHDISDLKLGGKTSRTRTLTKSLMSTMNMQGNKGKSRCESRWIKGYSGRNTTGDVNLPEICTWLQGRQWECQWVRGWKSS